MTTIQPTLAELSAEYEAWLDANLPPRTSEWPNRGRLAAEDLLTNLTLPEERKLRKWLRDFITRWEDAEDAAQVMTTRSPKPIVGYVVVYGNPLEGFKLHGPFPSREAADQFGEDCGEGGEWVMPLHEPDAYFPHPWSGKEG